MRPTRVHRYLLPLSLFLVGCSPADVALGPGGAPEAVNSPPSLGNRGRCLPVSGHVDLTRGHSEKRCFSRPSTSRS